MEYDFLNVEDKDIIKGLNLKINKGEVHAIMGPNGSGKSTLSYALSGKEGYEAEGEINYNGENILELNTEERAQKGIFLAFQYPIEIPGVTNEDFLRLAYNTKQKFHNKPLVDPIEFLNIISEKNQVLLEKTVIVSLFYRVRKPKKTLLI